ncbi:MAG: hypothetical protein AAFX06_27130 [Planctomycetota bacterium]
MNDESTIDERAREKPSRASALRSLSVTSNTLFGWILAATFLMPFAVGCDNKTVLSPMSMMNARAIEDGAFGVVCELFYQWPYVYGVVLPLWMLAAAFVRPKQLGAWLIPLPMGFLIPLNVGGVIALSLYVSSWDELLVSVSFFVLPQLLVFVWSALGLRKDPLVAATRGLSGLGAIATLVIYLHAVVTLSSRFLYGFYVALIATIGLTFSAWSLYARGEQTLSDTSLPRRRFQFPLWTMFVWTTVVAIIAAIYQVVTQES